MSYSAQDKLDAVKRELSFRRRVYERWVENGKMTKQLAERQIGIFESIESDYAAQVEKGRLL